MSEWWNSVAQTYALCGMVSPARAGGVKTLSNFGCFFSLRRIHPGSGQRHEQSSIFHRQIIIK